jgi:hypothetical protein
VAAVFSRAGRIEAITSTAAGERAGAIRVGASLREVRAAARRLAAGVWIGRGLRSGARYVYGVRNGRVRYVALVAGTVAQRRVRLQADLAAAGV